MGQESEKVVLYIYDLSQGMARQLSTTFLVQTIDGIWHTGVGVYGKEYFFGGGIRCVPAGRTPFGTPVQVTELGHTQIPKEMFEEYLRELGPRYTLQTYSLLHHNCNHFSDEVAQFLVGAGIPQHILRLPEEAMNSTLGAFLLPMFQQLETTLQYGEVPVVPQPRPQYTPNFGSISVPAAPARSTSRMSASGRRSSSTFPIPPVATTATVPPALSPVSVPGPAPPNSGTDQRRQDRERVKDGNSNEEK